MKRDAAGRYYVLAKPESVVTVYDRDGNLLGRIPNEKSNGATIRYAADIDLDASGQLVVADRGANAIEVFAVDGSFVSKTPVNAPTSIVALPENQFAVTSLTSQRLVQILDVRGKVVRSFGDPTEVDEEADKKALKNLGRISGDSAGGIYFAFTSLPDPTVRKYDRFGYVAFETAVPEHVFGEGPTQAEDRVELNFGYSEMSFTDQTTGWVTFGSSNDLRFGAGMGRGFDEAMRRGMGVGQAIQQQSMAQNGAGNGPFGAMFSGLISDEDTNFQLGMGSIGGGGGRGRGRGGAGNFGDETNGHTAALRFNASGDTSGTNARNRDFFASDFDSSSMTANLYSGSYGESDTETPDPSNSYSGLLGATGQGALPGSFVFGTMFDSIHFRSQAFGDELGSPGGGRPGGGFGHSGEAGMHGGENFSRNGYHGRYGANAGIFTGRMRVNLGDLGGNWSVEKPVITAMAMDPETHEIWAGIGDTLVHFSKDGDPLGIYYLALSGSKPLKPVALLVEPDRFLVATDPWGVFDFARPDRRAAPQRKQIDATVKPAP